MNYWKIAFFALLIVSMTIILFLMYGMLDQGITLTYQREGYSDTKDDLDLLVGVFNELKIQREEVAPVVLKASSCSLEEVENKKEAFFCNRIVFQTDSAGVLEIIYHW